MQIREFQIMRPASLRCGAQRPWRAILGLIPALALLLAGCGGKLYEDRLANTGTLFAHIGHLNDHLQAKWSDPETGVSLRPPLQFAVLPPPVKPEPSPEDKAKPPGEQPKEEEIHDDRQPKYLNVELPGLRGAFETKVKVIADNNAEIMADAWMYVLTNHHLAEKTDQAKEFNETVVKNLAEAVRTSPPAPESFEAVHFPPKVGNFVKPVKYTNVVLTPERDVAGLPRQFSIYRYEQGDIQVVILFVLPQNADASEKFTERIPLCLETLEVMGDRLKLPTGGTGAGAGGTPATF